MHTGLWSRRRFLHRWITASVALGSTSRLSAASEARTPVALTYGQNRAQNAYRACQLLREEIAQGLAGKRRIVIKPNFVTTRRQLAATHVECVEGILAALAPLAGGRELIVAESPASAPAAEGYSNYGYWRLRKSYRVNFLDLDEGPVRRLFVIDHRYQPRAVHFAKLLCDPESFVVSAAVMKTHDRTVATLSLKNVAVGGAVKEKGFTWRQRTKGRRRSYKPVIHGGRENAGIHYNLFYLARCAPPHLAVIDGFQGMEGNGPTGGDPVDHRVAVASCDFLAADAVALRLMGIDLSQVGYLVFCAREGLGTAEMARMHLRGEKIENHIKKYRLHDNMASQLKWLNL